MIGAVLAVLGGRGVAIVAGALAGLALLIGIYQTGVSAERKRGEAATLRARIAVMERQQQTALEIQTRMAQRMADLRASQEAREKQTDDLIAELRAAPAAGACNLSDARRLRLLSIRIGRPRADSRARQ